MKIKSILFTTLCSLMMVTSLTACTDSEQTPEPTICPMESRYYILNEGHWGANNASIAMFHHPSGDGMVQKNLYQEVNSKKMGDVANGMMKEDDNIYILLNGSKYVARLDLCISEQARYSFPESDGEPRCMDVEGDYAYVTQYGGQVTKLNIKDMTWAGAFNQGDNLEGIVAKNGKLYVANSYKVDASGNFLYNKEVFVIDSNTMTLENTIQVIDNPTKMYEIDDNIYLISAGNYYDIPGALQLIDPKTGTSKVILNDVAKITEGFDGWIYGVRSTYDANWQLTNSFFSYHPMTGAINESSFLRDAPTSFATDAIYLLFADEENGYIFVGTTDYQNTGTIYVFNQMGNLVNTLDSGGINPSTIIYLD